jgi:hypothetical protein
MAVGIPPYVAYRSFENFLAELKARGLPSRIDRSILSHKSGTVQSQLLLAFRYLDLLSDSGRPTEKLRALVASEGATRKDLLREIVKSAYGIVFLSDIDLRSATSTQVEELFQQAGASGETVRRCMAFFLAAARSAGIPFSTYLKPHRGKKPSTRSSNGTTSKVALPDESTRTESALVAKKVHLKSGGSLTLELSFDVFDLTQEDRQFVFDLIDQLNEYSEKPPE